MTIMTSNVADVDETEITYDFSGEWECAPEASQDRMVINHRAQIGLPFHPESPEESNTTVKVFATKKMVRILIIRKAVANRSAAESEQAKRVKRFMHRLHAMSDVRDENAALDEVIECFAGWLEENDWEACNKVLAEADVDRLLPTVSLGLLSMTLVEKDRLSAVRPTFLKRVRRRLIADYGEAEANYTLRGLE
jgi:hypothetical protein